MVALRRTTEKPKLRIVYAPRGAAREIFRDQSPELVTTGPAGTGKTLAWCKKADRLARKFPGLRILFARKTRQSLKESVIPTYENKVMPLQQGVVWRAAKGRYEYPNGSIIGLGGLDKPSRIMSTEWDLIIVFECTELTVGEWEALSTRLRNNRMPYQQLGGDANPDAPTHWLRQRIDAGKTKEYVSYHEDNPTLFDPVTGAMTEFGASYLAKLDNLTGVRYLRLRKGKWAAAEGIVYEDWNREIHLVDKFTPPMDWPRYWVIDFGFTHPFVWQLWVRDNDGRLYLWKEIYQTRRLVEEHARAIMECVNKAQPDNKPDRAPSLIITDPEDAEGRATLSRTWLLLGATVTNTVAAHKSVTRGIQEVQGRFKIAGDKRPRIFLMRDARIHPADQELVDARLPTCTADEVESYIWQPNAQGKREQPVKLNDHGMDAMRYVVAELDLVGEPDNGPSIYG